MANQLSAESRMTAQLRRMFQEKDGNKHVPSFLLVRSFKQGFLSRGRSLPPDGEAEKIGNMGANIIRINITRIYTNDLKPLTYCIQLKL